MNNFSGSLELKKNYVIINYIDRKNLILPFEIQILLYFLLLVRAQNQLRNCGTKPPKGPLNYINELLPLFLMFFLMVPDRTSMCRAS